MVASVLSAGPAGAAGGLGGAPDLTGCNKYVHRCSRGGALARDQVAGTMRENMVVWLRLWVGVGFLQGGGGGARPPRCHHCVCRPITERAVAGGCARAGARRSLVEVPLHSPVSTRCPGARWSLPARSSSPHELSPSEGVYYYYSFSLIHTLTNSHSLPLTLHVTHSLLLNFILTHSFSRGHFQNRITGEAHGGSKVQ